MRKTRIKFSRYAKPVFTLFFPSGDHEPGWKVKFYALPCLRGFDCNDLAIDDVKFINCQPDAQPDFYDKVICSYLRKGNGMPLAQSNLFCSLRW